VPSKSLLLSHLKNLLFPSPESDLNFIQLFSAVYINKKATKLIAMYEKLGFLTVVIKEAKPTNDITKVLASLFFI
jgi:hypothetical protein